MADAQHGASHRELTRERLRAHGHTGDRERETREPAAFDGPAGRAPDKGPNCAFFAPTARSGEAAAGRGGVSIKRSEAP
jgi:hypothetical protein